MVRRVGCEAPFRGIDVCPSVADDARGSDESSRAPPGVERLARPPARMPAFSPGGRLAPSAHRRCAHLPLEPVDERQSPLRRATTGVTPRRGDLVCKHGAEETPVGCRNPTDAAKSSQESGRAADTPVCGSVSRLPTPGAHRVPPSVRCVPRLGETIHTRMGDVKSCLQTNRPTQIT